MKKILTVLSLVAVCAFGAFSQAFNTTMVEKGLKLPDGSVGDVLFFAKWKDASPYANDRTQWKGKHTTSTKAKSESELGYADIWHNADENEVVKRLYDLMEASSSAYAVTYVLHDKGTRVRRMTFTYKKNKIRCSFMDFFAESHPTYIAYKSNEAAKQEKLNKVAEDVTRAIMKPIADSAVASENKTPAQTLYDVRHHTYSIDHQGYHGNRVQFDYRYIYRDDGRRVVGYIVDLDGNIRADGAVSIIKTQSDIDRAFPIQQYYSVPKDIRELALKSLE